MVHCQTDKIIRERGHMLYLVTGQDDTGLDAYYYVLVDKPKLQGFLNAFNNADMELTSYGKVIASGYGSVPEEVQDEMKKKYGDTMH